MVRFLMCLSLHGFPPEPVGGSAGSEPQVKVNDKQDGNQAEQDGGAVLEVDHAAARRRCSSRYPPINSVYAGGIAWLIS